MLPKMDGDYYGPNTNFATALATYGNAYELLYRESLGNKIIAESPTNVVNTTYPLTVEAINNTALVTITGGRGYVPVLFSGLTNITNPQLWKSFDNCWELVDQSLHGKDFWQVNFNPETANFDLIYNVNQDIANDETAIIQYYLGDTPPEPTMIVQSKLGDGPWSGNANITTDVGVNVRFAPQITEYGTTSIAINNNYSWSGPNGFTYTGRILHFLPTTIDDEGEYIVTYTNEFGCSTTKTYVLNINPILSVDEYNIEQLDFYPNPVSSSFYISKSSYNTVIYNISGQKMYETKEKKSSFDVDFLYNGLYFVKFELESKQIVTKRFIKR